MCHKNPDGDTIGSGTALCLALQQLGKNAAVLCSDPIPAMYDYMPITVFDGSFRPAFVVAVDVASIQLFGENNNVPQYAAHTNLCIDHHASNSGYAYETLLDPGAAAACEFLLDVIVDMGVTITPQIANCLYTGIATDTGCFKFSNTTAHSHAVAAACLTAGIDGGEINRVLFETKSRPRFEMERIVFDTMEFHENGAIAVAVLWRRDIDHAGADMDDLDSIASLTRQIEGVQIGITLTEKPDGTVRVSVRTTKEMDAAAICKKVGGGGHVRAAGASFTCGMAEAKAAMLKAAEEQFHAAK